MKLEVGMYVRTHQGIIYKITKEIEYGDTTICIDNIDTLKELHKITKASFNIIDLIEVGDYVNGSKVSIIENNGKALGVYEDYIYENDIKEILTKEQYEANCYKVGELYG